MMLQFSLMVVILNDAEFLAYDALAGSPDKSCRRHYS